jgi:hypothetical protein
MDVHLVDGTFELFRCFYGAPSRSSPSGQEVAATRALCGSLLSLLKDGATHVGVAFDTQIESFRNELFDGYKTGEGIDPPLKAQFPLAERASRALGLVTWSMIEMEADDALATMAARAAADPRVGQVLLCSPDKDLCQCVVGQRVVLLDRIRKRVLDEAAVGEKFGVPPAAIADLLALVGDDADGIPGLPGFGMKSARACGRYRAQEGADGLVQVRGGACPRCACARCPGCSGAKRARPWRWAPRRAISMRRRAAGPRAARGPSPRTPGLDLTEARTKLHQRLVEGARRDVEQRAPRDLDLGASRPRAPRRAGRLGSIFLSTLPSRARRSMEISVLPGTAVTKLGSTFTTPQVATTRVLGVRPEYFTVMSRQASANSAAARKASLRRWMGAAPEWAA